MAKRSTTKKRKPRGASPEADTLARQAHELARLKAQHTRIRDLSRAVRRVARAADDARVVAAMALVHNTVYTVVSSQSIFERGQELERFRARVDELTTELQKLTGARADRSADAVVSVR